MFPCEMFPESLEILMGPEIRMHAKGIEDPLSMSKQENKKIIVSLTNHAIGIRICFQSILNTLNNLNTNLVLIYDKIRITILIEFFVLRKDLDYSKPIQRSQNSLSSEYTPKGFVGSFLSTLSAILTTPPF